MAYATIVKVVAEIMQASPKLVLETFKLLKINYKTIVYGSKEWQGMLKTMKLWFGRG